MKQYTKPMISIDNGMAEGVYAASGANTDGAGTITISSPSVVANWGNSGQATFTLDLSKMDPSQLTVILTFNMDISNGWGGGANASVSGNNLSLIWYSAPSSADITVQANGDITQLKCTGYSYSNAIQ